jgi:hypothetical protein
VFEDETPPPSRFREIHERCDIRAVVIGLWNLIQTDTMTADIQNKTKVSTLTTSQPASRGIPPNLLKLVDPSTTRALEGCLADIKGDGSRDPQVTWMARYTTPVGAVDAQGSAGVPVEVHVKWVDAEGAEQERNFF